VALIFRQTDFKRFVLGGESLGLWSNILLSFGVVLKKIVFVLAVLVIGYLVNAKFIEVAYSLGFAELKKEAVLINDEKLKVKCHSYALGWFDEIKLENKFQKCLNEHQANGYKIMENSSI
tara:strand:+ start:2340 stop:2699 length:360 start_codon:yes stop_codon:yes gene_type:complete